MDFSVLPFYNTWNRMHLFYFQVPNDFLGDSCKTLSFDVDTSGPQGFLISIGLPQYYQVLNGHDLDLEALADMQETDWRSLGVTDPRHLRRLVQGSENLRVRLCSSSIERQKHLPRVIRLSDVRDKVWFLKEPSTYQYHHSHVVDLILPKNFIVDLA